MFYTYLIANNVHDHIFKVGITKDLGARLRNLQTGNPFPLYFVSIKGWEYKDEAIALENKMLELFANSSLQGEWFSGNKDEVIAAMNEITEKILIV